MNPQNKWLKGVGYLLNALIAALILFTGSGKVFGFFPPDPTSPLADKLLLIGTGEMVTAILLLIPWTSPFGVLLTSGFWGGVISFHMSRDEPYLFPSVLLALTWLGGFLRGSVRLLAVKSGNEPTNPGGLCDRS